MDWIVESGLKWILAIVFVVGFTATLAIFSNHLDNIRDELRGIREILHDHLDQ